MFRRRQVRTHGQQLRDELIESIEHLRLAAAHAAGATAGAIARVEPKLNRSVDWITDTAEGGARQASRAARRAKGRKRGASMTRKRWPMMIGGLLIAGAAAGAVGALMSRRRQQKWQEYGSGRQTDSLRRDAGTMLDTGTQKIASMTDTAKEKASDVLGQVRSTTPPMGDKTASSGEFGQSDTFTHAGGSAATSRNSRP